MNQGQNLELPKSAGEVAKRMVKHGGRTLLWGISIYERDKLNSAVGVYLRLLL